MQQANNLRHSFSRLFYSEDIIIIVIIIIACSHCRSECSRCI
jgi:hypothetical protein